MNIDVNQAIKLFWRLSDKSERFSAFKLLNDRIHIDDSAFWEMFWEIWVSHESLYRELGSIRSLLSSRKVSEDNRGATEENHAAWVTLPDSVTIYRGCGDENRHGWSWTTDYAVAEKFTLSWVGDTTPMVISGVVSKNDVLAYLNNRNEMEIVVDPTLVIAPKVVTVFDDYIIPKQLNFYRMAQQNDLVFPNEHKIRAEMMFNHAQTNESVMNSLKEMVGGSLTFSQELGLCCAPLYEELSRLITNHEENLIA